jgi:hypothetical protein
MKMLLSGLANSHPLVRVAAKYWWLAIPAGIAMWSKARRRDKTDVGTILEDFGASFGPVIPVILLGEMLSDKESKAAAAAPQVGIQGPIKEASFITVQPQSAAKIDPNTVFAGTTPLFGG